MKVLVTGGAGYIGGTTSRFLAEQGFEIAVVDNLKNGYRQAVPKSACFYRTDLLDQPALNRIFKKEKPEAVLHFAALASVGESVEKPLEYYENNVSGTCNLLQAMAQNKCQKLVFSSSASVYGNQRQLPITEEAGFGPLNPYAHSKRMAEQIIQDSQKADGIDFVILRYFNAAGTGLGFGEKHEPETHLIPLVLKTALEKRKFVSVLGTDYKTKDGSCIRDYVHVEDLAKAHELAIKHLNKGRESDFFNLGSGHGYSVLEIIKKARKITGKEIKAVIQPRRPGDPDTLIASNQKAKEKLGWQPTKSLEEIIQSAWEWEKTV